MSFPARNRCQSGCLRVDFIFASVDGEVDDLRNISLHIQVFCESVYLSKIREREGRNEVLSDDIMIHERETRVSLFACSKFRLHKLAQPQVEQKVIRDNLTCNSEIR